MKMYKKLISSVGQCAMKILNAKFEFDQVTNCTLVYRKCNISENVDQAQF